MNNTIYRISIKLFQSHYIQSYYQIVLIVSILPRGFPKFHPILTNQISKVQKAKQ